MHLKLCKIIFETLWGKLQNLLGIKLTSGETLLTLPAVDKDIYIFSCHRCWLWNYLNQRTFVTLVIGLLVQLNAIAKKLSWKTMVLLQFSEGRMDSCYSVTTLEPLGLMLRKVGIIKFGNPLWIHEKCFWNYLRQTSKFTWKDVEQLM